MNVRDDGVVGVVLGAGRRDAALAWRRNDREEVEARGENLLHLVLGEAESALEDVAGRTRLGDHLDRADPRADGGPSGEHDESVHLARRETDVGHGRLGRVREVGERGDVIGDIRVLAVDAPGLDGDVAPRLGVDDIETARSHDDEIDLAVAHSGPAAIGQQVVPDVREGLQRRHHVALDVWLDGVARGRLSGKRRGAFALLGKQ